MDVGDSAVDPQPDMRPDMRTDMDRHDVESPPDARPDDALPMRELCNGMDDDHDEVIDEGFDLGMPCTAGQGICAAAGVMICREDGMGGRCDAVPGRPSTELCNGLDDDCSGVIDEGFESVGEPCAAGAGVCQRRGDVVCAEDGQSTVCGARAADEQATLERCDGDDDDCDGAVDEGLVRSCTVELPGVCAAGRQTCADGLWSPCAGDVEPGNGRADVCNGIDDDCDFATDEEDLPDGAFPCSDEPPSPDVPLGVCAQQVEGCVRTTGCVEQCDLDGGVGFACLPAPEEDCDGRDDDCDGVVDDDSVCGRPIVDTCTFGLGWSMDAIPAPARDWGPCDISAGGFDDRFSCNGTRGDAFVTVQLPEMVDIGAADDRLGVTLRCSPGAVGEYIVSHCRVILGLATPAAGVADGVAEWGPCPAQRVGGDDSVACTSSTAQGGFEPMPVPFDLTTDQLIGIAFICADPDDPARAEALQSSIIASIAWADASVEGEVDWQAACAPLGDGDPYTACARTRGDGRFRILRLTADVDGGDRFAIRLSPL